MPYGLGQDIVDLRMRSLRGSRVLAPAILRDAGHRPGTIQRDGRDQILEPVGAHLAQHVAHPLPFHLEHAAGIALRQHLVGVRIVQRQPLDIDLDPKSMQQTDRALQDGQRRQAEEIEFDQPRLLDVLHRVLRHQEIGTRIAIQRHQLDQRAVADHHAGGMCAGMPIQTLDLQRDLQQPRDPFILVA